MSAEALGKTAPEPGTVTIPGGTGLLLLGLGLATGMEFYTNDSMNLVLPDIVGTLGVSADQGSWVLTVYSCALFLGIPLSIWMAQHYGYKRYLMTTVAVFALTSMGCATAPSLEVLLMWRAVQGLAAAGLYVWWRATVYLLLPKAQRSVSLMRISTMLYLSSAAGLLCSGYITDRFNWRLMFLPDLLYAAGALLILARSFPALPVETAPRVRETDYPGIALLAIALVSLQVILNRGQIDDWFTSPQIRNLTVLGGAGLAGFLWWEMNPRNRTPLLCLELLADRRVVSAALIGIFTGMILSGSLYALPEFLRNVASAPHTAARTGQIMCIYALAAAALRPLMVPLVARIGQRKTIVLALIALIVSMLMFVRLLTAGTPDTALVLPLMLYAACLSPLLPAVGSGTVAKIEQNKLLDGVSLYMGFRQFGAALGVALVAILIDRRESFHSSRLFEHLGMTSAATRDWLATAASAIVTRDGPSVLQARPMALRLLAEAGARQAEVLAYADAFLFMAAVGVVALCVVPVIPPTPVARKS